MSQVKEKVKWCIRKAEKEIGQGDMHRGLIKVNPDTEKAKEFIAKAEHFLKATDYLHVGGFSDISASTVFYSMYHCLLAIAIKFGYESRNQECTFALISALIEDKEIDFDKEILDKIALLDTKDQEEKTSIKVREKYQYGTSMTLKEELYSELLNLAKEVISEAKKIVEP